MFSNFKDAFIRRPQFTVKTPDAVLETISKGLPEGFRYVHDHDGLCRLECDDVLNITPSKMSFPEIAKSVFEGRPKVTIQDALEYAYNSQTKIELLPDEDDCFTVNGSKIKRSEFITAPLKGLEFKEGHLYVFPPTFPAPFPIELSGNGYSLTVMMQRVPMNSIYEMKFQSVGTSAIELMYIINAEPENTMQFNIKTNPSNRATEVLASKEIFNAFVMGKGAIGGATINHCESQPDKIVSEETLKFWRKVVEVEKVLGAVFDVNQEIAIDDVKTIDALFRCLVEKLPYKTHHKDSTLRGIGDFNDLSKSRDNTPIGKEILFEYTEDISVELLGVTAKLCAITDMFDCVVSEIELPSEGTSGEFFIKLVSAEGKRMYSSTQYYMDHDEMEKVHADKSHIEIFQNATELDVY